MGLLNKIQGSLNAQQTTKPAAPELFAGGLDNIADLDQRDEYLTAICSDLSDGPMHIRLAEQMGLNRATCDAIARAVMKLTDAEIMKRYGKEKVELKTAAEHNNTYQR